MEGSFKLALQEALSDFLQYLIKGTPTNQYRELKGIFLNKLKKGLCQHTSFTNYELNNLLDVDDYELKVEDRHLLEISFKIVEAKVYSSQTKKAQLLLELGEALKHVHLSTVDIDKDLNTSDLQKQMEHCVAQLGNFKFV